ncbi:MULTISPECIES: carbohydrate ABC transporter permease [unclassified Paenibacillus]|jgi:putative aldouronate transport system permease protein|uniref:carbohydrate ABC transporter permease n=1 Tax=unclassified Paenibacillus TaxID=185978 RepID=UPI00278948A9|nr:MULTISPECIES: carbohydrate ABC transporter permease [unclassified Paenibacillus]MDF2644482.1 transporter permease [Paenibacillus sp.]MDQ0902055.1 putative aldouronate transport system permease protein [Paenibacillus sp. V4I7]MDQ0919449.1 putative aldouronate transport system permease protein [Paenibacillus sp. V4I5]
MRLSSGEKVFQVFLIGFIFMVCAAMLYPFAHVLSISLSTTAEAVRPGLHWYPHEISFFAWERVVEDINVWRALGNTVFRTIVGTFLTLLALSMAAYPLSKKHLPHRSFYMMFIVVTMFFSGGLIPSYLLIKSLGLIDSRWVLIIPGLISTFSLLILRNFFMTMPEELEDSAKMDGASDLRILFTIVIPLSKPVLATLALWSAVGHWNAWFDAMIYLQDQKLYVLQTFLRRLVIAAESDPLLPPKDENMAAETVKAAVIMFTALPILIVYPFLQKYFVKGTLVGSLKG